jgi:hypothetical protein
MLAAQMIAAHKAAMHCISLATVKGQAFHWRELYFKNAAKLMSIFAQLVDTLNKHRGKGQQKVTVEHVTVQAGGQAVVGNVAAAQNSEISDVQSQGSPKAIAHNPGMTLDLSAEKTKSAEKVMRVKGGSNT